MNELENCQARYRSNIWMGRTRTDGPNEFEPSKFDYSLIYVWFHPVFKGVYMCILFKHSEGFAQIFVHYLFFNMGKIKLFMDKYPMAIYLSLGKYKLLLFPHPCVCCIYINAFRTL